MSSYNTSKSAVAVRAREKMEGIVSDGIRHASSVIERVQNSVIQDSIVRTRAVKVHPATGGSGWAGVFPMGNGERSVTLHNHAWTQVVSDSEIDKRFIDRLERQSSGSEWGRELIQHNINTIFAHRTDQRNLVREADGQVKGWLSNKFRRIDSRPLLDAFAGAAGSVNLIPVEGWALDTKVRVRALLPMVFEPVIDEPMLMGIEWGNSDFGDGGHVINVFLNRINCWNMAVTNQVLRQIHLGKVLNDDITYSEETYRKDTELNVSALKDTIKHVVQPEKVHALMGSVAAASKKMPGTDVMTLLKKHLDKGDAEKAFEAYEGHDVVNLPPGQTMWRLSNAISWIAQAKGITPEKRLELQSVAGELVPTGNIFDVKTVDD